MKNDSPIQVKSYQFALSIVKLYKMLYQQHEFVLSKQILKSGTSIGANVEEAIGAQSQKDFYAKVTIAFKEARETRFWLRLLRDSNYINKEEASRLIGDVVELIKLLVSIQKTVKQSKWHC